VSPVLIAPFVAGLTPSSPPFGGGRHPPEAEAGCQVLLEAVLARANSAQVREK
jgi:hypothetical protein